MGVINNMNIITENIDLSGYMEEEIRAEIRPSADYLEETMEMMFPKNPAKKPPTPMWTKCQGKIAFRPSETTLWAGINGHGKSMMLSQITLDLLMQNQKVLVISLEMTPPAQMARMSRQSYGGDPTPDSTEDLHFSVTDNLYIYSQTGSVGWRKIMAVCRYARHKFNIGHFIIDSLMKTVKGEDDYNGQKDFINEACSFSMANGVHTHIVHHIRKGESELKMPDKFDIRGASSIADQVDNIYIVFRHKNNDMMEELDPKKPTAAIKVAKSRHGNWEGTLGFWFHQDSMQYLESPDARPFRYSFRNIKGT